jgi:hypothetical protein
LSGPAYLGYQILPDALEGPSSEDDVRFREGFGKLFLAHLVAVNNVEFGNIRRALDQGFERFDRDWR